MACRQSSGARCAHTALSMAARCAPGSAQVVERFLDAMEEFPADAFVAGVEIVVTQGGLEFHWCHEASPGAARRENGLKRAGAFASRHRRARGQSGDPLETRGGDGAPRGAESFFRRNLLRGCGASRRAVRRGCDGGRAFGKAFPFVRPVPRAPPHRDERRESDRRTAGRPRTTRVVPGRQKSSFRQRAPRGGSWCPRAALPIARDRACEARPRTPVLLRQKDASS